MFQNMKRLYVRWYCNTCAKIIRKLGPDADYSDQIAKVLENVKLHDVMVTQTNWLFLPKEEYVTRMLDATMDT